MLKAIERMTGLKVIEVNVHVQGVSFLVPRRTVGSERQERSLNLYAPTKPFFYYFALIILTSSGCTIAGTGLLQPRNILICFRLKWLCVSYRQHFSNPVIISHAVFGSPEREVIRESV